MVSMRRVDTEVVAQRIYTRLLLVLGRTNVRYLPAHELANTLGPDHCAALSMYHAFIGSDSSFGQLAVPWLLGT